MTQVTIASIVELGSVAWRTRSANNHETNTVPRQATALLGVWFV